ncbi:MAG: alanyl-tRNA synthetase [Candidatus Magnetoglobus multicellularis str. Araruama]|uniref:Alanine--tRNA ligase n=1 Tax=Candidatus Magnetoglobus multicellularis str. Araruama TaxID=890399 RepID=A0A1V1P5B0_9BACT|nr:MAG: alanyl-tRNA synthetase [Candidatus Magnetoglobus multicellularis str. Araruama]
MTGNEARKLFLDYFQSKGHKIVKSDALTPHNDPTLLFTNAGMVPFKRIFLGEEKRDYVRATSSQKCVRAGGKHNDLENVGYTARHHTFFEMLGNFSFGDYFKQKAIEYAWDLLINGYELPSEKLWISVYLDDDEAYDIWHKSIGVNDSRIIRMGEKDNFWSMGDTGPCGPCSEILIDRGEAFGCDRPDCQAGCECDRYLEIWNLVFMQFNRDESGTMTPLPKPSIDTGMGLERIVSVIQNTKTNYETDLFMPIFDVIQELSQKAFGSSEDSDIAMKVIADHSRATAFLINDGILPSNEGRGNVLRRIMRRAIRYGRQIGLSDPFLHKTVEAVYHVMHDAYPELLDNQSFIQNVIINEEKRFSETLDNGLKMLEDTLENMNARNQTVIPGDIIFKLYDTYGFPVDIVQDIARNKSIALDMDTFHDAMNHQRNQSRSVSTFSSIADAYKNLASQGTQTQFLGYDSLEVNTSILLIVKDDQEIDKIQEGDQVEILTPKTPFYGESGGQMGDVGKIVGPDGTIDIENTTKDPSGLVIHHGTVIQGWIDKNQPVCLQVDTQNRHATALNHTATHILHAVLRKVLGDHVKQAGSMVNHNRLRFDFSHFSKVTSEELAEIEQQVNTWIRNNVPIAIEEMDMDTAVKTGATALFEEKYGEQVRVISIDRFSKELCGGTHTSRTGNIGTFCIISETSVAAGVRRIEALTGQRAITYLQSIAQREMELCSCLKETPKKLVARVEQMINRQKSLEKEIVTLKGKVASMEAEKDADDIRTINGISVLAKKVSVDSPADLREMLDQFKAKIKSGVVVLGAALNNKALIIVGVSSDLVKTCHAGKLVKQIAEKVGGGGGGRPDMAQAGGPNVAQLDDALQYAYELFE